MAIPQKNFVLGLWRTTPPLAGGLTAYRFLADSHVVSFLRTFAISSLDDLPALPTLGENEQMELDMDGMQPVEPEQAASASDGGREETE